MKIAIAQKRPGKDGRRLIAFYDDQTLVWDHAAEELKYRPAFRVPAVVCFEHDGNLSDWRSQLITFDPDGFELRTDIFIENHLHPWLEAGIRLAASDFKLTPRKGYSGVIELSLGKHKKPLYHIVWERWRIWQSAEHRERMKSYTIAAGAHEDLLTVFPEAMKGITPKQVTDACNRLGLPLQVSR